MISASGAGRRSFTPFDQALPVLRGLQRRGQLLQGLADPRFKQGWGAFHGGESGLAELQQLIHDPQVRQPPQITNLHTLLLALQPQRDQALARLQAEAGQEAGISEGRQLQLLGHIRTAQVRCSDIRLKPAPRAGAGHQHRSLSIRSPPEGQQLFLRHPQQLIEVDRSPQQPQCVNQPEQSLAGMGFDGGLHLPLVAGQPGPGSGSSAALRRGLRALARVGATPAQHRPALSSLRDA